ncbi:hypothetical protein AAG742_07470 [Micrococcus sp. 2A]|uniref:hypothetical protein n=1 Tax=Micrococcus sp. 2A TaxID=3142261 RepID=UPI00262C818C|nr:hypothetical protein [uncultured Micrococcus sp.]
MRWDGLFEDIEARWADLGWQGTVAEAAELTRAEWAGITLADRLRGARGADLRVHLVEGQALHVRVRTVGRTWFGVDLTGGGSAVVRTAAVAAVEGSLGAAVPEPAGVAGEIGLAAVLRGVARSRAAVTVVGLRGDVIVEGTVDRVGADHLDIARHARDEARRRGAVRGVLVVPFSAVGLVRGAEGLE